MIPDPNGSRSPLVGLTTHAHAHFSLDSARRVSERISGIPCPHGCRDRHASHRRDAARGRYFRATGYGPRPRYRGRVLRGHVGVGHPRGSSSGLGQSGAAACPVGRRRCAYCRDGRRELVGTAGRLSRRARGHLASPSNDLPRRVVRPVAVAWPLPPRRVLRGGSWNNQPRNLRSANRNRNNTDNRNNNNGFRVARTLSSPSRHRYGGAGSAVSVQGGS